MNEAYETLKTAVEILIGILVGFLGWIGKRNTDRIDELRETVVTRDELATALDRLREDRMELHRENRAALERIESKIDENEERSSRTRHDTNESVHALAVQLARVVRQGDER